MGLIFRVILAALALLPLQLNGQTNTVVTDVGAPDDTRFAALAAQLEHQGLDFDRIFAGLCQQALKNAHDNPQRPLADQIRSVFGGMWIWTAKGGRPALQQRQDWAMHFIGGGAFEGYWDVGTSAALIKERSDARDPSNRYDLNDLAATMLGARWIRVAVDAPPEQTRRWLERWATGKLALSRVFPSLEFGRLPAGEQATATAIQEVSRFVEAALSCPDPKSATP